jgi:hypothetical protein
MDWLDWIFYNIIEVLLPFQGAIFFLLRIALIITPIILFLRIFRDKVVRFFSRKRPVNPIEFSDAEVVKNSEALRRAPLFGALLFVPQGTAAVVAHPKQNILQLYQAGERVIHFPALHAFVQYVDIRRRTNTFTVPRALTGDGFLVTFDGNISWRVKDVLRVTSIRDPVREISIEVERAVRAVTIEYLHDQLVPHRGNQLISDIDFIERITQLLHRTRLFRVIDLHTIVLHARTADPNRTPPPKKPTEAELKAEANKVTLQNRKEMIGVEEEIAKHENLVKKQQARVDNKIRKEEIKLAIKQEQVRLEIERERIRAHERTATLSPVLQIFAHVLSSPGSDRMIDSWSMNRLSRVLENIVGSLWDDPEVLSAEYRTGPRSPENAREKLSYKLVELWKVEEYTEHKLVEQHDGSLYLLILVNGKRVEIWYDISGTDPSITKIFFTTSLGVQHNVPNPKLYDKFSLPELIQKLIDEYEP